MDNVMLHDLEGQSIEAEQALLGALLMAPDSFLVASAIVRDCHFVTPAHLAIYQAITESRQAGRAGNFSDIRQCLGSALDEHLPGGMTVGGYLGQLSRAATTWNAADYARAMRDLWGLRTARAAAVDTAEGLPEKRLAAFFDQIDALRNSVEESAVTRAFIGEIGTEVATQALRIAAGLEQEPGITTGLRDLDEAMLGFRPGELVVVAGRPGMGKSTVATAMAMACSDSTKGARHGGAGFFAFELGRQAIGARCLADISERGATHSAIRAGRIHPDEETRLAEAVERLQHRNLIVDSRAKATVGEIEAASIAMKRMLEKRGVRLDVIFIDYLKQVEASDRYRGQRVYEIGEITHGLREMGKRLGLCVVLLVQLNRGVESREDKRPTLADLRESGDIENDADVVIFLYRPAYYLQRAARAEKDPTKQSTLYFELSQVEDTLEMILCKNRNGGGEQTVRVHCDIGRSVIRPMPGSEAA